MQFILLLLAFLLATPLMADDLANLDGIYTQPRTFINDEGLEVEGFEGDYPVLEFQGDQFKYWHFSDAITKADKFPISGKFSRDGYTIILDSDQLDGFEKRYIASTNKGVFGVWPETKLKAWNNGEHPTSLPVLVRVADGPSGEELDQDSFKFPVVTALFDKEAAKRFWDEEKIKHELRYSDVPEPLRTLLREKTNRNDPARKGYIKLIHEQQQELNPELIKQLLAQTGSGVSVVVGPMVMKDLFGCGALSSDEPAFAKKNATKRAALQTLADAMPEAKNSQALTGALLVFLRTANLSEIDLTCKNGVRVLLRQESGRTTNSSYKFSATVATGCQRWANQRLVELFDTL